MGNLSTPKRIQKLQIALHAEAKAEAGYRFHALYDRTSREDILAHAYARCRSNKGAPGVDGQEFTDIAAYGVRRRPEFKRERRLREGPPFDRKNLIPMRRWSAASAVSERCEQPF